MIDSKDDGQSQVRSLQGFYRPGDFWTHYKGGVYQIVALAVKEDTGEPVVVYRSCKYGTVWVRTLSNWTEDVTLPDGTVVSRFKQGSP